MKKVKLTKGEKWKIYETCGNYKYCACNYETYKCTGYISGNNTYNE